MCDPFGVWCLGDVIHRRSRPAVIIVRPLRGHCAISYIIPKKYSNDDNFFPIKKTKGAESYWDNGVKKYIIAKVYLCEAKNEEVEGEVVWEVIREVSCFISV